MKNKVTLYVAVHNQTGLKYFGKTQRYYTEKDLQEHYHGSGVYWNRHLKKHGDDVTMKIYGIYEKKEVEDVALKFSEENNIVKSDKWANLILENGNSGNTNHKHSQKTKEKISQTKMIIEPNGKTKAQNSNNKALITQQTTVVNYKGKDMTILEMKILKGTETKKLNIDEIGSNISKALNKIDKDGLSISYKRAQKSIKPFIKDGELTSIAKERGKKTSIKLLSYSKTILVYDNNSKLKYTVPYKFRLFCTNNGLPFSALIKSLRDNNTLYEKTSMNKVKECNIKYKGWYARYQV